MIVETRYYALGNEHSAQEWGSIVATLAQGRKSGEQVVEQTYLDTFDWALCRNDISFIYEQADVNCLRIMTDQKGVKIPTPQTVEVLPVFPNDIPEGKMQKTVAKLIGLRALLVLAQIKSEQIIIHVEDKKGRVRVRLVVEVNFQRPAPGAKCWNWDVVCALNA